MSSSKVILFGGNGFVGTHIAKKLLDQNIETLCVSRSGRMPTHLENVSWAKHVAWIQGNATQPDSGIFDDATAIICLVGSPPIPTFSKDTYAKQLFANSQPNLGAISGAKSAGVSQLVLLGAHLPKIMQTDKFAYAKGKRLCLEAAKEFAVSSSDMGATVLQPTGIYGTRYTQNGKAIKLEKIMRPLSWVQGKMPSSFQKLLPEQLVSVEAVSTAAVEACLEKKYRHRFSIMSNQEIVMRQTS